MMNLVLQTCAAVGNRIRIYGGMIRFSHTVFALPFALSAAILAGRSTPLAFRDLFWILVAMASARSSAMGVNRIADAVIDSKNPRTAAREIPSKKLSYSSAVAFVVVSSALFILSAAMLGRLCLYLSIPVLLVLFLYSYTKRFTWLCHIYLGFAISLAPVGAWIAIADTFSWPIGLLSLALLAYIAGFDVLYACQDADFDKKEGLHSIPARFGVKNALIVSSVIHLASFLSFLAFHFAFDMGPIYLTSVFLIGLFLFIEQRLVKPEDLSRLDVAFFHMNSLVSVTLLLGVFFDELV